MTNMEFDQDTLRARFCHALSEMYKTEVPLYGDLIDLVWEADATALKASNDQKSPCKDHAFDLDSVLPSRNRVETRRNPPRNSPRAINHPPHVRHYGHVSRGIL